MSSRHRLGVREFFTGNQSGVRCVSRELLCFSLLHAIRSLFFETAGRIQVPPGTAKVAGYGELEIVASNAVGLS